MPAPKGSAQWHPGLGAGGQLGWFASMRGRELTGMIQGLQKCEMALLEPAVSPAWLALAVASAALLTAVVLSVLFP